MEGGGLIAFSEVAEGDQGWSTKTALEFQDATVVAVKSLSYLLRTDWSL